MFLLGRTIGRANRYTSTHQVADIRTSCPAPHPAHEDDLLALFDSNSSCCGIPTGTDPTRELVILKSGQRRKGNGSLGFMTNGYRGISSTTDDPESRTLAPAMVGQGMLSWNDHVIQTAETSLVTPSPHSAGGRPETREDEGKDWPVSSPRYPAGCG